jgi:diadenosine tetraphosphate (Ap4A) HIT family hydrolase
MDANCDICARVGKIKAGGNPYLIHEFKNSFLVVGDHQYFKGYAVVLLKEHVRELHDLSTQTQEELFKELMAAGRAVFEVYRPWKMNYSCAGNAIEHVHWHIFPRYESDPDHRRNPWLHAADFDKHLTRENDRVEMIKKIRSKLA